VSRPKEVKVLTFIDLETTGHDPNGETDEIIEFAAARYNIITDDVESTLQFLVKHKRPLNRAFHEERFDGVNWSTAISIDDALDAAKNYIDGGTLAGQNVSGFDVRMLRNAYRNRSLAFPAIDYHTVDLMPVAMFLVLNGELEGTSLKYSRQWAGCFGTQKHRAMADVCDCIDVFRAMRLRFGPGPQGGIGALLHQKYSRYVGSALMGFRARRAAETSEADPDTDIDR
jgi:DNA polymerase III epsilon subunit-like protein